MLGFAAFLGAVVAWAVAAAILGNAHTPVGELEAFHAIGKASVKKA